MPKKLLVMELYSEETEHTFNSSNITVEGDKVFQNIESYRDISNEDQLQAIIENLVLNRGFILDTNKSKELKLVNPTEPETTYYIWLDSLGIKKETKRFVGNIS